LAQLVRKDEIDTVLVVFPDGYGRLLGKRVVGRYFLDHVAEEGSHACIYLFTVDMELVPDLGTLRLIPWLPKTALVICDVYTEEGEAIEEAPRWILKRQVARA